MVLKLVRDLVQRMLPVHAGQNELIDEAVFGEARDVTRAPAPKGFDRDRFGEGIGLPELGLDRARGRPERS